MVKTLLDYSPALEVVLRHISMLSHSGQSGVCEAEIYSGLLTKMELSADECLKTLKVLAEKIRELERFKTEAAIGIGCSLESAQRAVHEQYGLRVAEEQALDAAKSESSGVVDNLCEYGGDGRDYADETGSRHSG